MNENKQIIEKYLRLKEEGKSVRQVFEQAKNDGYKNFECVNILMVVFSVSLDEARQISHEIYKKNK